MPMQADEMILDPQLPVIDTHHHLHDKSPALHAMGRSGRFLIDEYAEMLQSGHRVVASVCVEARAMYRADGPEEMKPVGETEFLNGQAAMSASGLYGPCRVGAGIVSNADLRLREKVESVLEAHLEAAPGRFRGIRQEAMWDEDSSIVGWLFKSGPQLYLREDFRRGFAKLAPLGLSFDAFVLSPQLADVEDLARSFPGTSIILNHLGNPVGIGRHKGRMAEEFPQWQKDIRAIANHPNVTVKLGGLGSFLSAFASFRANPPSSSQFIAEEWAPYVETAVEAFGADRCMFESNLPTDETGAFATVCNAFKRMTQKCSESEKLAIFAGTAARVYRLDVSF